MAKRRYSSGATISIHKGFLFTLLVTSVVLVKSNHNETDEDIKRIESEIPKKLKIVEAITGRGFMNNVYQNGTFRTGNSLWDNILNKCSLKPSVSCLQKNLYSYLDDSLDFSGDLSVSSGVCFKKNNVDVNKYSKEANTIYLTGSKDGDYERSYDEENEIKDDDEPGKLVSVYICFTNYQKINTQY